MSIKLTRVRLGLAAGTAALASTAVVAAASGSAQAPPASLHFVSKAQKGVGFAPNHQVRQGDRFGYGARISGDDTGVGRILCTAMKGGMVCTLQAQLAKGNLTAQGVFPERSHDTPAAVTGGTGAYDGARGTMLVTDVDASTSDVTVNLLP